MTFRSCSREAEIVLMLRRGHGPDVGGEELRAHIRKCGQCREGVLLTRSFQEARCSSVVVAPMGSAQALWWKAQVRQRDAALRQVSRPMAWAQMFALVVGAIVTCGFLAAELRAAGQWVRNSDIGALVASMRGDFMSSFALFGAGNSMFFGLGVVALLGGLVYVASDRT
jgi:hypothetical protein